MRRIKVYNFGKFAGWLEEKEKGNSYKFIYDANYKGAAISLTMPIEQKEFEYAEFPSFFDGLLPEGMQLENLLRLTKSDRDDYLTHLITVGNDLVGSVTVEEEF